MRWRRTIPPLRIPLSAEADQDEAAALLRHSELLRTQFHLKSGVLLAQRVKNCLNQVRPELGSADGCYILGYESQGLNLQNGIHERGKHVTVIVWPALPARDTERLAGRPTV